MQVYPHRGNGGHSRYGFLCELDDAKKIFAAGIPALDELMEIAQLEGVKFIACKMTIDMMGLRKEDFIEGVEIQTAEDYLKHARNCDINMFT